MPLKKIPKKIGRKTANVNSFPFQPTPFQSEVLLGITPLGTTLITAPTGSGKTEAAFLPALNRYLSSQKETHPDLFVQGVRIVFICPLKALVDDLSSRLEKIISETCKMNFPPTGVSKLTGDTKQGQRQSFRRNPKPILVTTPESLARLLAHPNRRLFFQTTQTVIVDEWHSLATTKRGADLSLSLARLSVLCPLAPKRIGLSATVANPKFLSCQLAESGKNIQVLASGDRKNPKIQIHSIAPSKSWADEVTKYLKHFFTSKGQTGHPILVFVQTRSMAERLTYNLHQSAPNLRVILHHGSLSETMRRHALQKILSDSPDIILSTASLELGMDIGSVRTVILLDTPGEITRMIQRIGRSGRGPNQTPNGILLIRQPHELLEAGLSASLGMEHWLEPTGPNLPYPPLDLLCQHLLGEAIAEPLCKAAALQWLMRSPFFPTNQKDHLAKAIEFLVGDGPKGNIGIPPRLKKEVGDKYRVTSNRVTRMVLQSIGTIQVDPLIPVQGEISEENQNTISLGPFKKNKPNPCVGYVDEYYADIIKPGDRFLLGGKVWERSGGDFRHIVAKPHEGTPRHLRWQGNRPLKSGPLCAHLYSIRALAKEKLLAGAKALADWLRLELPLQLPDTIRIADWLEQQERKSEIPDNTSILIESISTNEGQSTDYDIHFSFPTPICSKIGDLFLYRLKNNHIHQPTSGISYFATNLGLRILDTNNSIAIIGKKLGLNTIDVFQYFFSQENWLSDLRAALFGSDLHRRKFQESAHLSLMVAPASMYINQRTRVGGKDWPARRLFDRAISMNPPLLPLSQATNELVSPIEIETLSAWFNTQNKLVWKFRELPATSPFAKTWNLPSTQNENIGGDEDLTLASLLEALGDA